ncbi:MAG: GNAT family N-acetyltransferase [Chitinophagales bacterium]
MEKRPYIEIQALSVDNIPVLSRIAKAAYFDHFKYLWFDDGEWYAEKCFSEEALAAEYALYSNEFYFVLIEQEPVGFIKLKTPSFEFCNNCLELERIYLIKKFTGKGIGKYCLHWVESEALERNRPEILLKAMDSSKYSIAFYKKCGFQIVGETKLDFEMMKEECRGMVIMKKTIG